MIRREDVADLQPGDVVECSSPKFPGVSTTGPLTDHAGVLRLGSAVIRCDDGSPGHRDWTLTVVSRAPRLYVNSDRTEPVPGDVVRDAGNDEDAETWTFGCDAVGVSAWRSNVCQGWRLRNQLPTRLRLLVDGESGDTVPAVQS